MIIYNQYGEDAKKEFCPILKGGQPPNPRDLKHRDKSMETG